MKCQNETVTVELKNGMSTFLTPSLIPCLTNKEYKGARYDIQTNFLLQKLNGRHNNPWNDPLR